MYTLWNRLLPTSNRQQPYNQIESANKRRDPTMNKSQCYIHYLIFIEIQMHFPFSQMRTYIARSYKRTYTHTLEPPTLAEFIQSLNSFVFILLDNVLQTLGHGIVWIRRRFWLKRGKRNRICSYCLIHHWGDCITITITLQTMMLMFQ